LADMGWMDAQFFISLGVGVLLAFVSQWTGRARVAVLCVGVAFIVFGLGKYCYQSLRAARSSPTAYASALLDCFTDARVYQHRTVMQSSLPDDVVYVTRGGSQEVAAGQGQVHDQTGALLQLEGMFIQCSLKNGGDQELTDVSMNFSYAFFPGFGATWVDLNGRLLPKNQWRTVGVYSPSKLPISVRATARRSVLDAGATFRFSVKNFDDRFYGFLGMPTAPYAPLIFPARSGYAPPIYPTLSYRLGSSGMIEDGRALTLTCRAKSALGIPMFPAQKKSSSWIVEDKCTELFFGALNEVRRAFNKAIAQLPDSCKKYAREFATYSANDDCS
jgi:hypothetical protein